MTVCPICGETLFDAAIRCRGCSVILGGPSSERRFAPVSASLGSSPAFVLPERAPRKLSPLLALALFASTAVLMFVIVFLSR